MAEYRYHLRGEIDLPAAPDLRADLARAISRHDVNLVVDCTALTFIDSTGIAVLLEAHRDLEATGRQMRIVNVPPGPRRSFEILGMSDLLGHDRERAS